MKTFIKQQFREAMEMKDLGAYLLLMTAVFFGILVTGCSQNASTISASTAQDMVDHLTYFKDSRTNLCYAAVASRTSGDIHQNGMTITYVPCTPEVLAVITK